jgi:hypothetical protein
MDCKAEVYRALSGILDIETGKVMIEFPKVF